MSQEIDPAATGQTAEASAPPMTDTSARDAADEQSRQFIADCDRAELVAKLKDVDPHVRPAVVRALALQAAEMLERGQATTAHPAVAVPDDVREAGVSLAALHAANIARQAEWCPDQVPDLSFRGNELAGETGEACNVIKKLERERQGWRGSRATLDDLSQELADVVICADLCAVTAGIDLGAAVVAKFNATSEKQGLRTMLAATRPAQPAATPGVAFPDDPTPEMEKAFEQAYWAKQSDISSPTPTEHPDDGGGAFGYGYRAMRKAAPVAATPRASEGLWEAATRLVDRLDRVHDHPAYRSVWAINQLHAGPYCGPKYEDELDALRAAIASAPEQGVGLPEGWVAVPREPTEEMNWAGWRAKNAIWSGDSASPMRDPANCYRAMLAAVPATPHGEA